MDEIEVTEIYGDRPALVLFKLVDAFTMKDIDQIFFVLTIIPGYNAVSAYQDESSVFVFEILCAQRSPDLILFPWFVKGAFVCARSRCPYQGINFCCWIDSDD